MRTRSRQITLHEKIRVLCRYCDSFKGRAFRNLGRDSRYNSRIPFRPESATVAGLGVPISIHLWCPSRIRLGLGETAVGELEPFCGCGAARTDKHTASYLCDLGNRCRGFRSCDNHMAPEGCSVAALPWHSGSSDAKFVRAARDTNWDSKSTEQGSAQARYS
jgi:hypothetical protein